MAISAKHHAGRAAHHAKLAHDHAMKAAGEHEGRKEPPKRKMERKEPRKK